MDLVDIARFERAMARTPRLAPRLFTEHELAPRGSRLPDRSLAARFAAKEALIKAFGDSGRMGWHDMVVTGDEKGNPSISLRGEAQLAAHALGVRSVHLSMSHDAGVAIAFVVAED